MLLQALLAVAVLEARAATRARLRPPAPWARCTARRPWRSSTTAGSTRGACVALIAAAGSTRSAAAAAAGGLRGAAVRRIAAEVAACRLRAAARRAALFPGAGPSRAAAGGAFLLLAAPRPPLSATPSALMAPLFALGPSDGDLDGAKASLWLALGSVVAAEARDAGGRRRRARRVPPYGRDLGPSWCALAFVLVARDAVAAAAAGARSSDAAGRDAFAARERAALRRPADAPVLHHVPRTCGSRAAGRTTGSFPLMF